MYASCGNCFLCDFYDFVNDEIMFKFERLEPIKFISLKETALL